MCAKGVCETGAYEVNKAYEQAKEALKYNFKTQGFVKSEISVVEELEFSNSIDSQFANEWKQALSNKKTYLLDESKELESKVLKAIA
jgi:hypothetical protein